MKLVSTQPGQASVDWRTAVLNGLAANGGLFVPQHLPMLPANFLTDIKEDSLNDIASKLACHLMADEIPRTKLQEIVQEAFSLTAPLVQLSENIFCLELFHGPTAAFKDFGARFMAGVLEYFAKKSQQQRLIVLTATSGDTGSAVAHGFYKKPGIEVVILYPRGKVSKFQEQHMTTLGGNIHALEIDGCFDDCQRLVKKAFLDQHLTKKLSLTSANSINIARLIPQSFYYFYAYTQLLHLSPDNGPPIFSVPSGNFGNLCAGLMAKKIGLPVNKFIASTNANRTFSNFLEHGHYQPQPSVSTLSNAMDVGNPSNLARILYLYDHNIDAIKQDIAACSFDDHQTIASMREIYQNFGYIADPHSAIGYLGLKSYLEKHPGQKGIFLATADPGKFFETVKNAIGLSPALPESLKNAINMSKQSVPLANDYSELHHFLLQFE